MPVHGSGDDADAVIVTRGLTKDHGGGRGVFDLDLAVPRGEVFGFLGPNGAGKSTTIRLLLDLIRPTSGSAHVLGTDAHEGGADLRRRIGFLPADLALYPQLTGRAVLDHLAALRGDVDPALRAELVERFDVDLDRPVRQLSSGNRQKLGLVQAFWHRPELVVLDEPIAGLDPLVQRSFHEYVGEVRADGRTVFLSSHTLSEVERVTDRVAVLRAGRLVVVDRAAALRQVAVQRLEFEFTAPVAAEEFSTLPGVRGASARGDVVTVEVEGEVTAVLQAAARHGVRAVRSREADLEDVFLRFYRADGAA